MCLHRRGAPAVHVFTGRPHQTAEAVVREGKKKKEIKPLLTFDPSSLGLLLSHPNKYFPRRFTHICELPFTSVHTEQEWQSGSNELPGNLTGIMGGSYTRFLLCGALTQSNTCTVMMQLNPIPTGSERRLHLSTPKTDNHQMM